MMHEVSAGLLRAQAEAVGLRVWELFIPRGCEQPEYESAWAAELGRIRASGINAIAFGDLLVEDIRRYREDMVARAGLSAIFPLWGRSTDTLAQEMIAAGMKARVVCVDTHCLPRSCLGREYDSSFLTELPPTVDPCGENGEFHTFVYDGPMLRHAVPFQLGELREHGRYVSIELLSNAGK